VLAAALLAAGTGCSGDKSAGGETAGATTAASTTTTSTTSTTSTGSTSTTPTTTERVTTTSGARPKPPANQSRWASQVDDACRPWQQRIAKLAAPTDAASLEAFLAGVLPLVRKEVAAVKAVPPPGKAQEADQARHFVASLQALQKGLTRYLSAVRSGDQVKLQSALVAANTAGSDARTYAFSLHVTQCGGYSSG